MFRALWPVRTMKASRNVGLGQSIGLGLTLIVGCAGLITLMSYAAL